MKGHLMSKYYSDSSPSSMPSSSIMAAGASSSSAAASGTSTSGGVLPTQATGGTPLTLRKTNMENIQLAECIGNVRALLIGIFCDDI